MEDEGSFPFEIVKLLTFDPPQMTYRDIKEGIYNIGDILDMIEIVEMKEELQAISIEEQDKKYKLQQQQKEKSSKRGR